eukprot:1503130-Rhodomonas_salina.2
MEAFVEGILRSMPRRHDMIRPGRSRCVRCGDGAGAGLVAYGAAGAQGFSVRRTHGREGHCRVGLVVRLLRLPGAIAL